MKRLDRDQMAKDETKGLCSDAIEEIKAAIGHLETAAGSVALLPLWFFGPIDDARTKLLELSEKLQEHKDLTKLAVTETESD